MNVLKKIFPAAFMPTFQKSVGYLILGVLLHFAAGVVYGAVAGVLALLIIPAMLAPLVGLYLTASAVIMVLVYTKVIKVDEAEAPAEAPAEETTDAE